MAHQGLREFSGEELAGLALGQNGFHLLSNNTFTATDKGITYWIAIKAIHGTAVVKAQSYGAGDDFSQNGDFSGSSITMVDGDIVYGMFDKITVDSSKYVLAYIGK